MIDPMSLGSNFSNLAPQTHGTVSCEQKASIGFGSFACFTNLASSRHSILTLLTRRMYHTASGRESVGISEQSGHKALWQALPKAKTHHYMRFEKGCIAGWCDRCMQKQPKTTIIFFCNLLCTALGLTCKQIRHFTVNLRVFSSKILSDFECIPHSNLSIL